MTHNAARMSVDAILFRSVEGKMIQQSFPPSSIHVGIMFSAAAIATLRPTVSLPMTVNEISTDIYKEAGGTDR
jgi:hypothetical protein